MPTIGWNTNIWYTHHCGSWVHILIYIYNDISTNKFTPPFSWIFLGWKLSILMFVTENPVIYRFQPCSYPHLIGWNQKSVGETLCVAEFEFDSMRVFVGFSHTIKTYLQLIICTYIYVYTKLIISIVHDMRVSWNGGTSKSSIYRYMLHYKPSFLGDTLHLWKAPRQALKSGAMVIARGPRADHQIYCSIFVGIITHIYIHTHTHMHIYTSICSHMYIFYGCYMHICLHCTYVHTVVCMYMYISTY
jgi:hypothetical protein